MQTILKSTLAALALCTAALSAQAQEGPSGDLRPHWQGEAGSARIDARQARQHERIARGVASGRITPHEAQHLRQQQRHIRHAERHAKADGVVTVHERARLERMQDHASRSIRHQARDAQMRPHRHGHWRHG